MRHRPNKRNYNSLSPMALRMIETIYALIDEREAPITPAAVMARMGNLDPTTCMSALRVLRKRKIIELDDDDRDDALIVAVAHPELAPLDVRTMHRA